MKTHLPSVDMDKLRIVLEIKEAYNSGQVSLDDARQRLRTEVVSLRPWEIALAEQELKTIEEDECRKENIQQMLDLFRDVMDTSRPDLDPDHPIMCYYRENDEMRRQLKAIEDLVQYPIIKNQWLALYDELAKWRTHLARKQNQLYSILERKGFDRPTSTMWLLDDFIRDEIRDARRLIEEDRDEEFLAMQQTIIDDVLDLMQKEETVLYPTSLAMITPEEFEDMKSGDHEIGFAFISVGRGEDPQPVTSSTTAMPTEGFGAELAALLGKYGYGIGSGAQDQLLDVATGRLTLEQINLIYKHLPVDISYVDEHDLVCFYSDTDHRVFPRSKNVIGREVKNCHPRTSVHLVEEIIEKFRSGEEDSVDFWINKPGLFIYIYYVAVRDEQGKFRGVLEMMQDCTRIRELQDSRTLLKWSKDTTGARKGDTSSTPTYATSSETSDNQGVVSESVHAPIHTDEASTTGEHPTAEYLPSHPTKAKKCGCEHGASAEPCLEITKDTRLKALLDTYPGLKAELPKINEAFKMLNSPLARIIIPKATVGIMAERSGMELDDLIPKLRDLIARLKG